MLQVETFCYPTLDELKEAQNVWLKDMCKTYEKFTIVEFKQSGSVEWKLKETDTKNLLIQIYYTVS